MSYKPKTYYIITFGCQANTADSMALSGILESLGFEQIIVKKAFKNDTEEMAHVLPKCDLLLINTCSIRQKSEDKVYGIGRFIKEHLENKKEKPFIVMAGCMVGSVTGNRQRYAFEELQKKTPWVDVYINPSQILELPSKLKEVGALTEWAYSKFNPESVNPKALGESAFVNISFGCDNFCTFCVVPYARGAEISRTKEEIIKEIKHLVSRGVTKITLCGQNVNSWGLSMKEKFKVRTGSRQKLPFASLLKEIHEISEIKQIDFLSSNPFDFTMDLINTLKLPKIANYLHIAVQSGNNEVLKKMNRRHTIEEFYLLIDKIKKVRPNIELGTDIIVGFPGETQDQFKDTIKLMEKIKFNVAFISMYSARKGTPSQKFYEDGVPYSEKKKRHAILTKVWKDSKNASSPFSIK